MNPWPAHMRFLDPPLSTRCTCGRAALPDRYVCHAHAARLADLSARLRENGPIKKGER